MDMNYLLEKMEDGVKQNYEDLRTTKGDEYAAMVLLAAKKKVEMHVLRGKNKTQEDIDKAISFKAVFLYTALRMAFPNESEQGLQRLLIEIIEDADNLILSAIRLHNKEWIWTTQLSRSV